MGWRVLNLLRSLRAGARRSADSRSDSKLHGSPKVNPSQSLQPRTSFHDELFPSTGPCPALPGQFNSVCMGTLWCGTSCGRASSMRQNFHERVPCKLPKHNHPCLVPAVFPFRARNAGKLGLTSRSWAPSYPIMPVRPHFTSCHPPQFAPCAHSG